MGGRLNLENVRFGCLIAKEPAGKSSNRDVLWKCVCDCGKETIVNSNNLRSGHTRSCGCLKKTISENRKKTTQFDLTEDCGVGYTTNTNKKFLFDKEDYDLIKNYTWRENDQGYIVTKIGKNNIRLHRMVFDCKKNEILDHRNQNRADNRKQNLRIATKQQNGINRGPNKNNPLGVKGVSYNSKYDVYVARIMVNGVSIHLGSFKSIEEACCTRKEAEEKYFGEFAYNKEASS